MPRAIALRAAALSVSQEIVGEGSRWISRDPRQQCLYLRPDPQGQDWFLPTLLGLLERLDTGCAGRWYVRASGAYTPARGRQVNSVEAAETLRGWELGVDPTNGGNRDAWVRP